MTVDRNVSPPAAPVVGASQPIVYPESDGEPMAENTRQWEFIVLLVNGLRDQFAADPKVFIAGDLFWYPVEGDPNTRAAPDCMVAFGRPAGHRGSYMQWMENHIAPQVVFEVLSPSNRPGEMLAKRHFYERHGVEEYYVLDPEDGSLEGWRRGSTGMQPIANMQNWTSPKLGMRFVSDPGDVDEPIKLYHPDGRPFTSYREVRVQLQQSEERAARSPSGCGSWASILTRSTDRASNDRLESPRPATCLPRASTPFDFDDRMRRTPKVVRLAERT